MCNQILSGFVQRFAFAVGISLSAAVVPSEAANFNVTTPGGAFAYTINGQGSNPTLTLTRGVTYTFGVTTDSIHPFRISTTSNAAYNTGVTGNNTSNGTITWTVPTNAPSQLRYVCSFHFFFGTINIVDPPIPPTVRVLSLSLTSSNVTVKSTGTNGFTAVPEFSSNLVGTISWTTVPGFTNTFANGTNTTVFNRLEPICGPNVFLRIRNQ